MITILTKEEMMNTNGGEAVSHDSFVQTGYSIGFRIGRAIGNTISMFKAVFS